MCQSIRSSPPSPPPGKPLTFELKKINSFQLSSEKPKLRSNVLLEQEFFWTVLCLQLINEFNRIKLAKARISFRCRLLILPQASFYDVIIFLWAICSWKRTLYFKTPPYLKLKTCIFLLVQTPTPPRQCLNSPPRARTTVKCLWVAWGRFWSFELISILVS